MTSERSTTPPEHYQRTVARIAKIQSHLTTVQRTCKLKGKVVIITGVNSLKGIGYALSFATTLTFLSILQAIHRITIRP
jgi:hypothetical protein